MLGCSHICLPLLPLWICQGLRRTVCVREGGRRGRKEEEGGGGGKRGKEEGREGKEGRREGEGAEGRKEGVEEREEEGRKGRGEEGRRTAEGGGREEDGGRKRKNAGEGGEGGEGEEEERMKHRNTHTPSSHFPPHQYLQQFLKVLHDDVLVIMHGPAPLLGVVLALLKLKEDLLQPLKVPAPVQLMRG